MMMTVRWSMVCLLAERRASGSFPPACRDWTQAERTMLWLGLLAIGHFALQRRIMSRHFRKQLRGTHWCGCS